MRLLEKDRIKPLLVIFIIIVIVEVIVLTTLINNQFNKNQTIINKKTSEIIAAVENKYPNVTREEVLEILNSNTNFDEELSKYGIEVEKSSIIKKAQDEQFKSVITDCIILVAFQILMLTAFFMYLKYKENKIEKITNYLKEINNKKYTINLKNMSEGELSKLESELYKITVMLKEEAENSKGEKLRLAESIADISHQLKTPLTSISIMLDNLNDDTNMDQEIRRQFIKEITNQIEWMKWLVISLLKFSKLDADAVQFKKSNVNLKDLTNKIIENMCIPLEIKDIEIIVTGNNEDCLIGDFSWQSEALTNILKNCIEHTPENKKIYITYEENNLYSKIIIKDEGKGISPKDLPHIFERFYKGQNSNEDSYGIGLALAKAIIEKDNGSIACKSQLGKGTTFEIKYAKI